MVDLFLYCRISDLACVFLTKKRASNHAAIGTGIIANEIEDGFSVLSGRTMSCAFKSEIWREWRHTFPSGWTIFNPICLSTVSKDSSHTISSLNHRTKSSHVEKHIKEWREDWLRKASFTPCNILLLNSTSGELGRQLASTIRRQRNDHQPGCQPI